MLSANPKSLKAAASSASSLSASVLSFFFFFYHTDSSLLFLLSLCIASPGELLLPVLKTKPDESLTFLDLVLALIHELNSAPVSINLVSVKLPSEYSSAKPE